MKMAGKRLTAVSTLTIMLSSGAVVAAAAAPAALAAPRAASHLARAAQPTDAGRAVQAGPGGSGPGGYGRMRVVVFDCMGHPQIRPRTFVIACADRNRFLNRLRWLTWGPRRASGRGVEWVNTCTPTCVNGRFRHRRVRVVFWRVMPVRPVRGLFYFSRLTVNHRTYPMLSK